jgi:hypothetical protein
MNNCHDKPNQNISSTRLEKRSSSFAERSIGNVFVSANEAPKRTFTQLRKKKVGPNKYRKISNTKASKGNKSKKKLKNKNSAIKKIEPGNPKKIRQFIKDSKNNLGHTKLIPLISVISLVLKRRFIASTRRKELVERRA